MRGVPALSPGRCRWGTLDVSAARYGLVAYRLTMLPPGATRAQARHVRAWAAWWTVSPLVGVLLLVAGSVELPALEALMAASTAFTAASLAIRFALRRDLRGVLRVGAIVSFGGAAASGEAALVAESAGLLAAADAALAAGSLTPAQHELAWARAYGLLAARP